MSRAVLVGGPLDGFTDTLSDVAERPPAITVDWCEACHRRHIFEVALEDVDVDPLYILDPEDSTQAQAIYRYLDFDEQLDTLLELAALDLPVTLPAMDRGLDALT